MNPSQARKGIQDLEFRVEQDVDMVFASFICREADVLRVKRSWERKERTQGCQQNLES